MNKTLQTLWQETRESDSVRQRLYQVLRQSIIRMVLEPGQALSEKELAGACSGSRQPVQEACIRLPEGGGLLGGSSIRGVGQAGVEALANQFFKTGRVGNAETGEPLSDAIIEVPDLGVQVISDAAGRFALAGLLPRPSWRIRSHRAG